MVQLIVGWCVWALALFFAVSWAVGCSTYARHAEHGVSLGSISTTVMWWLALIWSVADPDVNKLHLLWLYPTCWFAATVFTLRGAMRRRASAMSDPPSIGLMLLLRPPSGLILLLCGEIAALVVISR